MCHVFVYHLDIQIVRGCHIQAFIVVMQQGICQVYAMHLPDVHERSARCRYKGLVMVLPSLCNDTIQPLLHHNPPFITPQSTLACGICRKSSLARRAGARRSIRGMNASCEIQAGTLVLGAVRQYGTQGAVQGQCDSLYTAYNQRNTPILADLPLFQQLFIFYIDIVCIIVCIIVCDKPRYYTKHK